MSADLILRYPSQAADPVGNLHVRFENTINSPIDSIVWRGNGQAIAGTYELTFHKSGVVTVDVLATGSGAASRNPWGDRSGLSVTADDTTENQDLIPGLGIVVDSSTDEGWEAIVTIGNYLSSGAVEEEVLEFEVVQAGLNSSGRQVACRNVGTEIAQGVYVYALPGFWFDGAGAETFIEKIVPHSDPTRHKLAGKASLVITFADWKDDVPSGKKSADIYVGANKAVEDALFDGITQYEYGVSGYDDGNDYLAGLGIVLPDTTADPTSSSITLQVRDGYSWIEFAPDVSGSPGTYSASDLSLGDIAAADHELFWIRAAVPSAAQPEDPCRMINIRARGLSI
ncbi:MAG: hypothetical protein AMS19_02630 [Gemmatimonas sp. SG8_23]|nr:MAG: hypothetical protein AMS19_02630 [Gemmatimonas sp. SG8_23]